MRGTKHNKLSFNLGYINVGSKKVDNFIIHRFFLLSTTAETKDHYKFSYASNDILYL